MFWNRLIAGLILILILFSGCVDRPASMVVNTGDTNILTVNNDVNSAVTGIFAGTGIDVNDNIGDVSVSTPLVDTNATTDCSSYQFLDGNGECTDHSAYGAGGAADNNTVRSVDGVDVYGTSLRNIDFVAGTNMTITPDNDANTITFVSSGSSTDTNFMTFSDFNNWYVSWKDGNVTYILIEDSNNTARLIYNVIVDWNTSIWTSNDWNGNIDALTFGNPDFNTVYLNSGIIDTNFQTYIDFNNAYVTQKDGNVWYSLFLDSNNLNRLLYGVISDWNASVAQSNDFNGWINTLTFGNTDFNAGYLARAFHIGTDDEDSQASLTDSWGGTVSCTRISGGADNDFCTDANALATGGTSTYTFDLDWTYVVESPTKNNEIFVLGEKHEISASVAIASDTNADIQMGISKLAIETLGGADVTGSVYVCGTQVDRDSGAQTDACETLNGFTSTGDINMTRNWYLNWAANPSTANRVSVGTDDMTANVKLTSYSFHQNEQQDFNITRLGITFRTNKASFDFNADLIKLSQDGTETSLINVDSDNFEVDPASDRIYRADRICNGCNIDADLEGIFLRFEQDGTENVQFFIHLTETKTIDVVLGTDINASRMVLGDGTYDDLTSGDINLGSVGDLYADNGTFSGGTLSDSDSDYEIDDLNLNAFSFCDANEALTGGNNCQDLTGFDIDTGGDWNGMDWFSNFFSAFDLNSYRGFFRFDLNAAQGNFYDVNIGSGNISTNGTVYSLTDLESDTNCDTSSCASTLFKVNVQDAQTTCDNNADCSIINGSLSDWNGGNWYSPYFSGFDFNGGRGFFEFDLNATKVNAYDVNAGNNIVVGNDLNVAQDINTVRVFVTVTCYASINAPCDRNEYYDSTVGAIVTHGG